MADNHHKTALNLETVLLHGLLIVIVAPMYFRLWQSQRFGTVAFFIYPIVLLYLTFAQKFHSKGSAPSSTASAEEKSNPTNRRASIFSVVTSVLLALGLLIGFWGSAGIPYVYIALFGLPCAAVFAWALWRRDKDVFGF
jgi:fatty acid desaturase